MHEMESLKNARNRKFKKFTGWNVSKNALNGKFKKMHGIGTFKKKSLRIFDSIQAKD